MSNTYKEIEMQVLGADGEYKAIRPVPAGHKSEHASGGKDAITPDMIGAQEKLVGTTDKVVGFDADGNAVPVDAPDSNSVIEQNKKKPQKFWRGTQAEYEQVAVKDEDTMYIVVDESGEAVHAGDMFKSVYDKNHVEKDIFEYIDAHKNNNNIHITEEERTSWNSKISVETDPTVPSWAKQATKPTYTASEVGALPSSTVIPSKTSQLTNDSGFITGYTETDPTVPQWAKAASKPSYTASEVGAIPTSASCNKNWNWSGQNGQPSWLWGGNDGTNMYVYNPSNFNVNYATSANYANSAGNANTVGGQSVSSIISSAQSGAAKIQTGSYVGTGTYGASNPCSLTFNFTPKLVTISEFKSISNGNRYVTLYYIIDITAFNKMTNSFDFYYFLSSDDSNKGSFCRYQQTNNNTISWYASGMASNQCNISNYTYYWIAIG